MLTIRTVKLQQSLSKQPVKFGSLKLETRPQGGEKLIIGAGFTETNLKTALQSSNIKEISAQNFSEGEMALLVPIVSSTPFLNVEELNFTNSRISVNIAEQITELLKKIKGIGHMTIFPDQEVMGLAKAFEMADDIQSMQIVENMNLTVNKSGSLKQGNNIINAPSIVQTYSLGTVNFD
jgi:hypothetical protein